MRQDYQFTFYKTNIIIESYEDGSEWRITTIKILYGWRSEDQGWGGRVKMDAKGLRTMLERGGFDVAHVSPHGRTKGSAGHDSRIEVSENVEGKLKVDVFVPMFSGHESQQTLFDRVYEFLANQGMEVKVGEKQVGSIKRKFILVSP